MDILYARFWISLTVVASAMGAQGASTMIRKRLACLSHDAGVVGQTGRTSRTIFAFDVLTSLEMAAIEQQRIPISVGESRVLH